MEIVLITIGKMLKRRGHEPEAITGTWQPKEALKARTGLS